METPFLEISEGPYLLLFGSPIDPPLDRVSANSTS